MKRTPLIAVVDDEESIRRALERLLRSVAMDVVTFESGEPFLAAMQQHTVDCVVLDLHMSGVNGFEVQAQLAQMNKHIPIIVMTGHDTADTRTRVLLGGAAVYLLKPIDESELLDAIANAIGTKIR